MDNEVTSSTTYDRPVYDQESDTFSGLSENEGSHESMTDDEDEQNESDDDKMTLETQTVPTMDTNRRSNAHYGLRQNPRPNQRWS